MKARTIVAGLTAVAFFALSIIPLAVGQGQGDAAHTYPTNVTVDATNVIWTCPFTYNWITFVNDSGTNIYMTPDATYSNNIVTNVYNSAVGTSVAVRVSVTNVIVAAVGKGVRLNSGGGAVFFDATGKPTTSKFQFISQGGNGNNVSIEIGATK